MDMEILKFIFPTNKQTFSSEAFGRERTNQVLDTTTHVNSVIKKECSGDPEEIIGELQFCYLTGMILGNIWCLAHWQHIVKIVFRAFQLTLDNPKFFKKFVEAVHTQLTYDGVGIDGSVLDYDNDLADVLKSILAKFKARVEDLHKSQEMLMDDQKAFQQAFDKFEEFLRNFGGGWDLGQNYLRSGKYMMEDGELVEAELTELQDEDERGEFAPAIVELDEDGRETGLIRF
jgi:A1 cistron-splicing factor AAR2